MLRAVTKDDGAVAIIAAVVIGFLSLALLSLTIDVGQMYAERRELQNGADAAVIAVARELTANPTLANSAANTIAGQYAGKNALDTRSVGEAYGPVWGTHAPYSSSVYGISAPPAGPTTNYVEVRTATESSSGGPLDFFFHSGDATISAFARAAWGSLGSYDGFPVSISVCEWNSATSDGTDYAPAGPYSSPSASLAPYERVLKLHTTSGTSCPSGPAGQDVPGGFGWLDHDGAGQVETEAGGTFSGDPGVSLDSELKPILANYWSTRQVIYLPIYNLVTGTGTNSHYRIEGYAAFVVTGYSLPGGNNKSWVTNKSLTTYPGIGGSDKVISGFFTEALVSGTPGGSNFGVTTQPTLVR